jgi:class 3 adenylate cyclase
MLEELNYVNEKLMEQYQISIKIGVGINTGELMLGIIGDKERMESTVLGDAVNIASRIEELTKEFNFNLLISDETKKELKKSFTLHRVGQVTIKGKAQSIIIWGVTK